MPLWLLWSITWTEAPSWATGPEILGPTKFNAIFIFRLRKCPKNRRHWYKVKMIYCVCWHLRLGCVRGDFSRQCMPSFGLARCSLHLRSLWRTMRWVWSKVQVEKARGEYKFHGCKHCIGKIHFFHFDWVNLQLKFSSHFTFHQSFDDDSSSRHIKRVRFYLYFCFAASRVLSSLEALELSIKAASECELLVDSASNETQIRIERLEVTYGVSDR